VANRAEKRQWRVEAGALARAAEQGVGANEGKLRCAHLVTPHPFERAPCRGARSSLMSLRSLTRCSTDLDAYTA
jgi:hypothetical protein